MAVTLLLTPTFLGDADGATAHAHTQPVHASINQILGLSCCHHWGVEGVVAGEKEQYEGGMPLPCPGAPWDPSLALPPPK